MGQIYSEEAAHAKVAGAEQIKISDTRKTIDFVRTNSSTIINESDHKTWILQSVLKVNQDYELQLTKSETDAIGIVHYEYQEYYKNIKVEHGRYKAHLKDKKIISVNGEFYDKIQLKTNPDISKNDAFAIALTSFKTALFRNDTIFNLTKSLAEGELVILSKDTSYFLAYKFDLYSEQPLRHAFIYVDAHSNKIIEENERICNSIGIAITAYSGAQQIYSRTHSGGYQLVDTAKGLGIYTRNYQIAYTSSLAYFHDIDNFWNDTSADQYGTDVHWGTEVSYDFFKNNFNRNSFDNSNGRMTSFVRYSTNYNNAFWDGHSFFYGDGDGVNYKAFTSLEVVAHEVTHAYTEHTANLFYNGESGALNESFSDIFGVTISMLNLPGTDWYMGKKICIPNGKRKAFRNLSNPNEFNNPDTYGGLHYAFSEVHNQSGVQNYWYYLLVNGGTGINDIGNNYVVNGIGLMDAAKIAYRNLSVYLSDYSTYSDARFYSIQAAIDLYGHCSNQVVQTTNAWHAVGVGSTFDTTSNADFTSFNSIQCSIPASVSFKNNSNNAIGYQWDFGDNTTSVNQNPTHTYLNPGNYAVKLISVGAQTCVGNDTITKPNFCVVSNGNGPKSTSCIPTSTYINGSMQIINFKFGSIAKYTDHTNNSYKDFTCDTAFSLIAGDTANIKVITNYTGNFSIYIDLNNDGILTSTERIFYGRSNISNIVYLPSNVPPNTSLRLRLQVEAFAIPSDPCLNLTYGNTEDYTVIFKATTIAPIANFTANDSVVDIGNSITFYDKSYHAPQNWSWSFHGGIPNHSNLQNPIVFYNQVGIYRVTLRVSNSFGTDSLIKNYFVRVVTPFNLCSTGNNSSTKAAGVFYDSGGPTSGYPAGEHCRLLIKPGCGTKNITLVFTNILTGPNDGINIYAGSSTKAPKIGFISKSKNNTKVVLKANSESVYIAWSSANPNAGWKATWVAEVDSTREQSTFSISDTFPAIMQPVNFRENSLYKPISWQWNFSDGSSSQLQNPSHSFLTPGEKTITLIDSNCVGADTSTQIIKVQFHSSMMYNLDSISKVLSCNDSLIIPIKIKCNGPGSLFVTFSGSTNNTDALKILTLITGVDTTAEYPHLFQAINQYNPNYINTISHSTSPAQLKLLLKGKDLLLLPEQESGSSYYQPAMQTLLFEFVENGGTILFCGSENYYASPFLYSSKLFNGYHSGFTPANNILTVVDTNDVLMHGIPSYFPSATKTYLQQITNVDKVNLVTINGKDVVTYRKIGLGKVVYSGFDYYTSNPSIDRIAGNIVSNSYSKALEPWMSIDKDTLIIQHGDSAIIFLTLNANYSTAGNHFQNLVISSNDSLHFIDTIPVNLTITGNAMMALSDSCFNFGVVGQFATSVSTDTLTISNLGCDTLKVRGFLKTGSVFTLSDTLIELPDKSTFKLLIKFNSIPGIHYDTLYIQSNVGNASICLSGKINTPVSLQSIPDTLLVNFTSCTDSIVLPIKIINNGDDSFNLSKVEAGIYLPKRKILVLLNGASSNAYFGFINSIKLFYNNFSIITTNTTDPNALDTSLNDIDILLLPYQSYGTQLDNALFGAVIRNFIAKGGTAIISGSDYGNTANRIYNWGLFKGVYRGYVYQPTTIQLTKNRTDNFLLGIKDSLFQAGGNQFYQEIINQDNVPILIRANDSTELISYRKIGLGKVVYFGALFSSAVKNNTTHIAANIIKQHKSLNKLQKISSLPTTINGHDTISIFVSIKLSNLENGLYTNAILIYDKDTVNPFFSIPIKMAVSGFAKMEISDSCAIFPNTTVKGYSSKCITISNTGCDTLRISSISSTNNAFHLSHTSLKIAPFSSDKFQIEFIPITTGNFYENISIVSNTGAIQICLIGTGVANPISISNDTIDVSVVACVDKVNLSLDINNSSSDSLQCSNFGVSDTLTKKVIAMTYGVDYNQEFTKMIEGIKSYYTNFSLDTTNTTSPIVLKKLLTGKDILIFPEQESGTPLNDSGFASVLKSFLDDGGTLVICGSEYSTTESKIYMYGLFHGMFNSYTNNSPVIDVSDTLNPLLSGVSGPVIAPNSSFLHLLNDTDKIRVLTFGNYDLVSYRKISNGRAIYLGFDFYDTNEVVNRIAANIIRTSNCTRTTPWIKINPLVKILEPGQVSSYNAELDIRNLGNGVHYGNVSFYTNNASGTVNSVIVKLNVAQPPCSELTLKQVNCTGNVQFTGNSKNATSILWKFGDGDSSSIANTYHKYSASGNYIIQFISCNQITCDTTFNTLNLVIDTLPVDAFCIPQTSNICCNTGIKLVQLQSINNTSTDSIGYEDFTCLLTSLYQGQQYNLNITTGSKFPENVKAWIDLNNNGVFDEINELVLTSSNILSQHTGSFSIGSSSLTETPLRMRISSEFYGYGMPSSCSNLLAGQCEDYTILLRPNSIPPSAGFNYLLDTCNGIVSFVDHSLHVPTSFLWNFGDGNNETSQNPVHQYVNAGTFIVTLIVANNFGSDTLTQLIEVKKKNAHFNITGVLEPGQLLQFLPLPNTNGSTYFWDFGDNTISTLSQPFHSYPNPGIYIVTLVTHNGGCDIQFQDTLAIFGVSSFFLSEVKSITLFPNPFTQDFTFSYELATTLKVGITICDLSGRIIKSVYKANLQLPGSYSYTINLEAAGMYQLIFEMGDFKKTYKLIKN